MFNFVLEYVDDNGVEHQETHDCTESLLPVLDGLVWSGYRVIAYRIDIDNKER